MSKKLKSGQVKFEWTKPQAKIITSKGFTNNLNRAFAKIVASYSYEYVPYSYPEDNNYEGAAIHLADLYYIQSYKNNATIVYTKAYASTQYTGNFNHSNQMHPKATKRWCEVAWQQNKQAILNALNNERRRLSK